MYDLHLHSTASDGTLTPGELVRQAAAAGIGTLALTDHDTVAGLGEAGRVASELGVRLIPGVELSVTWKETTVHIVGLGVDAANPELCRGLRELQQRRQARAEEIGRCLSRYGIPDAFPGACALAGAGQLTRSHFARYLVERGYAPSMREVFERFLTRGKPGYVAGDWVPIATGVAWIKAAGGIAVLAHPQHYRRAGMAVRRLVAEFKEAGGEAIEVVSGNGADLASNAALARRFGLLASVGSDYHGPEQSWLKLGRLPALPEDLIPVWSTW
ncbi:MAG TPA: PHP domain-containing protein [Methylococcus sp.]|nr:PHP domain-containing protein [Methylococcus sp.]